MKQFIFQTPNGLLEILAYNLIEAIKTAKQVAGDAQNILDVAKPLIGDKYHSQASNAISQGMGKVQHYHDIANTYNEQGIFFYITF